jgi:hypothetical protein
MSAKWANWELGFILILKPLYTDAITTNGVHAGAHRKHRNTANAVCGRAEKGLSMFFFFRK